MFYFSQCFQWQSHLWLFFQGQLGQCKARWVFSCSNAPECTVEGRGAQRQQHSPDGNENPVCPLSFQVAFSMNSARWDFWSSIWQLPAWGLMEPCVWESRAEAAAASAWLAPAESNPKCAESPGNRSGRAERTGAARLPGVYPTDRPTGRSGALCLLLAASHPHWEYAYLLIFIF